MMSKECWGQISREVANALELLMEREKLKKFRKSQSLEGIATRRLNRSRIPSEIRDVLIEHRERPGSFCITRARRNIPPHLHDEVGEMYLGGNDGDGIVVISNPGRNQMECETQSDLFTIVRAGGSHGLNLGNGVEEIYLFSIKFQ